MIDFTYFYPCVEEDTELKKLLRECKTDEERAKLLTEYQTINVIYMVIMFVVAVAICGVISLFIW